MKSIMEAVISNRSGELFLNHEKNYIYAKWLHIIDLEALVEAHMKIIDIMHETGYRDYIADLREASTFPTENQEHLREEVFPKMKAAGIRASVVIQPKSVFTKFSNDQFLEKINGLWPMSETTSVEHAEEWLKELETDTSVSGNKPLNIAT